MRTKSRKKEIFHKVFLLFVILLLPTFLIREYKIILSKKDYRILPMKEFEEIEIGAKKSKNFVFIVLTHNVLDHVEDNFHSILNQDYPHYRVVYLDSGSTDGSIDKLRQCIANANKTVSIDLALESDEESFFRSYYQLIHACNDDDVVIHLYGTERLAHNKVLACLNQTYANPGVWLTYGQYLDDQDYQKGRRQPTPQKSVYRKKVQRAPWMKAHLKTFYAGLFKKIEFKGVSDPNYFLSIRHEQELLFPLAEMGKSHVQFIPDVLSIHYPVAKERKRQGKLSLFATKEPQLEGKSRAQPQETCLAQNQVDVVLFAGRDVKRLYSSLEALCCHLSGIRCIQIVDAHKRLGHAQCTWLKKEFLSVELEIFSQSDAIGFKELVLKTLVGRESSAPYVLFTTDQAVLKEPVDLNRCILAMQKTGAYGFYFNVDYATSHHKVSQGIYSWRIGAKHYAALRPHPIEMGLYRKIDLEQTFKKMPFTDDASLALLWSRQLPKKKMALSFDRSKVSSTSTCIQNS